MKPIQLFVLFIVLGTFTTIHVKSQDKNPDQMKRIAYLKKSLEINESPASEIDSVLIMHTESIKKLLADQNITSDEKRLKFNILIMEKYKKLRSYLNENQVTKLMPTSELKVVQNHN